MNELFDFLKGFNIQTILSIVLVIWYFTRDIKSSIESLTKEMHTLNTRVSRIEGSVYGKDVYNKVKED